MVVGAVAPVVVHGDAGLPHHVPALLVLDAVGGDDLLGADKVAVIGGGVALPQGAEALAAHLQAVVDDDAGLKLSHHVHQLGGAPRLAPHDVVLVLIGEVEPQNVQLAVVGADFPHLVVHVLHIAGEVPLLVGVGGVVAHGVVLIAVVGVVVVVPVQQSEVQAHL